jgi:membrane protease YdiL (CAAX protease family)
VTATVGVPVDQVRDVAAPPAWIGLSAVAAGTVVLLARPALARTFGWTDLTVITVFAVVLALGLVTPVANCSEDRRRSRLATTLALSAGLVVFSAGRLLAAGHTPDPATIRVVVLNTMAAVAEEALFRRVAFAALLPAGPWVAIGGSAVLFGLAHATVYGWWVLPVDISAGLVLGWQRWVSGSWTVPALTHAFADLLVVI